MIDISHETLVWLSKSAGLFYLIFLSIICTAYAFWPSNHDRFDKASKSILDDENGPLTRDASAQQRRG